MKRSIHDFADEEDRENSSYDSEEDGVDNPENYIIGADITECEKVVFDEIENQLTKQTSGSRSKVHPLVTIARTFVKAL
jgi:hypothetical protein